MSRGVIFFLRELLCFRYFILLGLFGRKVAYKLIFRIVYTHLKYIFFKYLNFIDIHILYIQFYNGRLRNC